MYLACALPGVTVALLRAILNTAVREDEILRQNPCRIKGYDQYHTPERPTATIAQVYALADAMPARFSALVVVAALSGLRWGELVALRRRDIDLDIGTIRVTRSSPPSGVTWSSGRPSRRPGSGSSPCRPPPWKPCGRIWPSWPTDGPQGRSGGIGPADQDRGDTASALGRRLVERATGIEPAPSVWKTEALPLSYARVRPALAGRARQPTESRNRTRSAVPRAAPGPPRCPSGGPGRHTLFVATGCGAAW